MSIEPVSSGLWDDVQDFWTTNIDASLSNTWADAICCTGTLCLMGRAQKIRKISSMQQSYVEYGDVDLSDDQKIVMRNMLQQTATANSLALLGLERKLKRQGQLLKGPHPLRVLGFSLSDDACFGLLRMIAQTTIVWKGFKANLQSQIKLMDSANILRDPDIQAFCKEVYPNNTSISRRLLQARDTKNFPLFFQLMYEKATS